MLAWSSVTCRDCIWNRIWIRSPLLFVAGVLPPRAGWTAVWGRRSARCSGWGRDLPSARPSRPHRSLRTRVWSGSRDPLPPAHRRSPDLAPRSLRPRPPPRRSPAGDRARGWPRSRPGRLSIRSGVRLPAKIAGDDPVETWRANRRVGVFTSARCTSPTGLRVGCQSAEECSRRRSDDFRFPSSGEDSMVVRGLRPGLRCTAAVELEPGLGTGLRLGWEAVRPRSRQCEPAPAREWGSPERVKRGDKRGNKQARKQKGSGRG